jgi:tetratricopeptide (TPR) repeat protein
MPEAPVSAPLETTQAAAPAPTAPPPAEISREGNEAVVALLDNAAGYVGAGDLDMAAASLERALRIEPRNASIWHDLGQIRLHQRKYEQAESLATKSNSLAGDNSGLKARNWQMIAVSRRSVGDSEGADAAEAQATLLSQR